MKLYGLIINSGTEWCGFSSYHGKDEQLKTLEEARRGELWEWLTEMDHDTFYSAVEIDVETETFTFFTEPSELKKRLYETLRS